MDQLELPDDKKELIIWDNAAELLKMDASRFLDLRISSLAFEVFDLESQTVNLMILGAD